MPSGRSSIQIRVGYKFSRVSLVIFILAAWLIMVPKKIQAAPVPTTTSTTPRIISPFNYYFRIDGILHETKWIDHSTSPYFWLTSGGKFILSSGTGKTIQGELPPTDKWRLAYLGANPIDTDDGYHPQNIFRLVTKSQWKNFSQEIYFKINKDNVSRSPNRNASNGVLFFNRYLDQDNIYYTGVRVDGAVVIKKKFMGTYYTLAYQKVFSNPIYDREVTPDVLPKNTWIGLKSVVTDDVSGSVSIKLFMDVGKRGVWHPVLEIMDNNRRFGAPLSGPGYAGIRTDFMDVEFDNYRLIAL